jgi:hypothetical protein
VPEYRRRFNPLLGYDEKDRKEAWGQQLAGNPLLYEIFTTLEIHGKLRICLLRDMIWSRHRLEWRKSYIEKTIGDLTYVDHILARRKIGGASFVYLSKDAEELIARARMLHPGGPPPSDSIK